MPSPRGWSPQCKSIIVLQTLYARHSFSQPSLRLEVLTGPKPNQWVYREGRWVGALIKEPHPVVWSLFLPCNANQFRKFWKRWEYQTTLPASWEICMQIRKQQLELDMEQQTGSKQEKEYIKAVYCHHAYLTYMQSTSWEMLDWMKHKLESRLLGEMSVTSDMQMTPPLRQKVKK